MKLFAAFSVFMAAVIGAFAFDYSLIISLFIGLICFMLVGALSGYSFRQLCKMAVDGNRDSMIVVEVMLIIGLLTASWRISGTVAIFVYYGIKVITPPLFLITAFLLSCLLSYAIGTSFGVAGTVGVIFMTLARSGGVDPILTAGALMSGVYFGDRCSPVSSSANLVAAVTGTDIFENVKAMMRTALLPLILSIIIYAVLSVMNPITHVSSEMLEVFESEFSLSLWAFLPAAIMLLQSDHSNSHVQRPSEETIYRPGRKPAGAGGRYGKLSDSDRLHDPVEHRLLRSPGLFRCEPRRSPLRLLHVAGSHLLLFY